MSRTGPLAAMLAAAVFAGSVPTATPAGQPPTPSPSPPARGEISLADYAGRVTLSGLSPTPGERELVITNETLDRLRAEGSLTTPQTTTGGTRLPSPTPTVRASRRAYWRRRVQAQRDRIASVTDELARADARVRALEDVALTGGRGAVKRWARVDEAKRRRLVIVGRLRREQKALARILHAARAEGAEPGWFR